MSVPLILALVINDRARQLAAISFVSLVVVSAVSTSSQFLDGRGAHLGGFDSGNYDPFEKPTLQSTKNVRLLGSSLSGVKSPEEVRKNR